MAYGREMLGNLVRKAGDLDARYAQAVDNRFNKDRKNPIVGLTAGAPIRDAIAPADEPAANWKEQAALLGIRGGAITGAIASRYALPAGGLTAAGVAIYDLTQQMQGNQQTSGTMEL